MSSYTEARCQEIGGGLYTVVSPTPPGMWFYVGNPATGIGVMVPDGFITDGPSLPSWLKILLHLVGLRSWVTMCLLKASVIHDRMREDPQFSLLESDCYFLIAMKADQKNWSGPGWACVLLREAAFLGVRTNRGRSHRNYELAQSVTSQL